MNGYVANAVFQVTAEPAQFAVACNKNNLSAEIIKKSKVFAISVIQKDAKSDITGTFGYKSGKDINKFTGFTHRFGKTGAPILLQDTIAWFECEVIQIFDVGSHLLFIGKVVDGDLINPSSEPLTYSYYREYKKGKAPKNAPTYIDEAKLITVMGQGKADKYVCPSCSYVYDPESGDRATDIPPGTQFEDLPDDWVCPICGTEKAEFFLMK
jgi:flavin reductase (DIM6/NTAB) family NADH-FMN oxidoreductase RutF/rubredoxin